MSLNIGKSNLSWGIDFIDSTAQRKQLTAVGNKRDALTIGGCNTSTYTNSVYYYSQYGFCHYASNMINCRYSMASAGDVGSALVFGGLGSGGFLSCTEEYDGSSWSVGGSLTTSRNGLAGGGTQNAAIAAGGNQYGELFCTEEYDGSSWSSGGVLNIPRRYLAEAGTQNSFLIYGGYGTNECTCDYCTEEYNGVTWSNASSLISPHFRHSGTGMQNAALAVGGFSSCATEEYNGSSWATGNNLNCGDKQCSATVGTSTEAVVFGGTNAGGTMACYAQVLNGSTPLIPHIYSDCINFEGWSQGAYLNPGRYNHGGAGTQNSALAFGGVDLSSCYTDTQEYNGISWSTGGSLSVGRETKGAGTQNAALAVGEQRLGSSCRCTEEYNGTSWSTGGALINNRAYATATGTQNAALSIGGTSNVTPCCTEEYNGTSWSNGGGLIAERDGIASSGTQNSALAFGGIGSCSCGIFYTEKYNGTSWISVPGMNQGKDNHVGAGSQNAAIAAAGNKGGKYVESYNGCVWVTRPHYFPLTNVRWAAAAGDCSNLLVMGGFNNNCGLLDASTWNYYEYQTGCFIKPLKRVYNGNCLMWPYTAWSSGGNLITARLYGSEAGTQNAALFSGGRTLFSNGVTCTCTEEYNGSSWSTGGNLPSGRCGAAGFGTQNAAALAGGRNSPTAECTTTYEYNGSSWSTGGNLIQCRAFIKGAGTQNSGITSGGYVGVGNFCIACTEEYNGTSWATGGALNQSRRFGVHSGTQNATLISGGALGSGGVSDLLSCTEEYNGVTWSTSTNLLVPRCAAAGSIGGLQNSSLSFGGLAPGHSDVTEHYNGINWSVETTLNIPRGYFGGAGNSSNALAMGGETGFNICGVSSTEEYNP